MRMLGWMDAVGPEPLGQESAIKQLRPVLFGTIRGAATVRPRGYMSASLGRLLGWLGPLLTVHATDPLPATLLYIAVTPDDFRIYGKPMGSGPFEIGRWSRGSYRASIPTKGLSLKLDLELERLGRIRLIFGLRMFAR